MAQHLDELPEWYELCHRYRFGVGETNGITLFATEALHMDVTWQQDLLFECIAAGGGRTSVASGHGCFGLGTSIMKANGDCVPVESIAIGDQLMGDDGRSVRNVLELKRGQENMYWFTYSDNTSHVFNESHILCLVRDGEYFTPTVRDYLFSLEFHKYEGMTPYRLLHGQYIDLPIQAIEPLGLGDYYGFVLDGNSQFLGGDFTVLHNTGKSRSAAVVALWHLLFFPDSVMMFTAPQINQLRKIVWKEISLMVIKLKAGNLAWLADYAVVLSETVYIKNRDKSWHVIAKTAPKHSPTNIAGQHGDNYMLWVDEACGVDDAVLDAAMGALTHKDNRAVMTSQPARPAGFFHDTHHKLSHRRGGVWSALTFNGEESPLVSDEVIAEQLQKYGSRDDAGYMVRVRGLFPDLAGEFLVSMGEVDAAYRGDALTDRHDDFGYIVSVDVGGGVGRDDSVVAVAKVWGDAHWGERARRVEVVDIPLCKNRDDLHEIAAVIDECMLKYPNASLVVDTNGAGRGLGQHLKSRGLWFKPIHWGGECFNNDNREQFHNKRSQAIVCLSRAIKTGRFKVKTKAAKIKIEEQLSRLAYSFDGRSRFVVTSKKDNKAKSPDLADAFAFLFLEGVNYIEATANGQSGYVSSADDDEWAELERAAESL